MKIQKEILGFQIYYQNIIYFSINKKEKCLFSRRLGYRGKIIFGYSIVFRFLNIELL